MERLVQTDPALSTIIAARSKSFSLASRLLPAKKRRDAVVLYAWCRQADDAVDEIPAGVEPAAYGMQQLRRQRRALDDVYGGSVLSDPLLAALRDVVSHRAIPREYPDALLDGMAMDVGGHAYETRDDLMLYCHRAAGTVGLMMAHVLGVDSPRALRNAAHLGMGMQLTNICRDVLEDLRRGRIYLPLSLLRRHGGEALIEYVEAPQLDRPFSPEVRKAVAVVVRILLDEAQLLYRSGAEGSRHLSFRSAFAVHTASRVYAAIGDRLRGQNCDALAGRVFVSTAGKIALAARALGAAFGSFRLRPAPTAVLSDPMSFPHDILPV